RRGVELAEACGAVGLAKKAGEELKLAHGRQHRQHLDPDALTAAELRVRNLPERGVKSKHIADQLFVSPKTIDTHLQRVYRTLGITSQRGLIRLSRHTEPPPPPNGGGRPRGR